MQYISNLEAKNQPGWPRNVSILGSTGSIGNNALEVIRRHKKDFRVQALSGALNTELLAEQAAEFRPSFLGVLNPELASDLKSRLPGDYKPTILTGPEGYAELAGLEAADMVLCAQVGAAGLLPAYTAVSKGKTVLLANKEALVLAGKLLRAEARKSGAVILPVDSEHNAVFQCLHPGQEKSVFRVVLTASGGPFRTFSPKQLREVTREQALDHPNWSMGAKISVDSATMMNKGLEVIEAHHLFGLSAEEISVVVHPQSIVHSLVEYCDGSMLAHMGVPDMKVPIGYCLSFPERMDCGAKRLDLARAGQLTFETPAAEKFPCLVAALKCLEGDESLPIILNAANEVAVEAFLQDKISFVRISDIVQDALGAFAGPEVRTLEDIFSLDREVRERLQNRQGL